MTDPSASTPPRKTAPQGKAAARPGAATGKGAAGKGTAGKGAAGKGTASKGTAGKGTTNKGRAGRETGVAKAKAKPAPRKPAGGGAGPNPPAERKAPLVPIVATLTLGVDQLSKWVVVQRMNLPLRQEIDLIDPWLNLRMAWNQGMNFGLMASSQDLTRWLLIGVALVICVWVSVWVWRVRPGRLARIAAGLLIGGAIGNVIDRVSYGAVADFLNMSLPGWRNPYSFNIADIAIFAGAIGLILQPQTGGKADSKAGDKTGSRTHKQGTGKGKNRPISKDRRKAP